MTDLTMQLQTAVNELREQRTEIDDKLEALKRCLTAIGEGGAPRRTRKTGRRMSAATRAKMAKARRAWWAAKKRKAKS